MIKNTIPALRNIDFPELARLELTGVAVSEKGVSDGACVGDGLDVFFGFRVASGMGLLAGVGLVNSKLLS